MAAAPDTPRALEHERIAHAVKHWVRVTAACNNRCTFCLDTEAQDGRMLPYDDVAAEVRRGRDEKGATRLILSGGEASIHPRFVDLVRLGRAAGYERIQTVTNGRMYARREFFLAAVGAGLGEITFSLHGHTAELHDTLVGARGAFVELMRGMLRAVRDPRVIVNVDVVINKQNVEHLEKIVALCAQAGVTEFDLLHVIPQGAAFENRESLFYDPDEHAEALRRVFRLARHPGFHVWTNRFPVHHLEGMEELIQDPHKMLDEVSGRRVEFRRYLDAGEPLSCRGPERCPHCFIEPFCSSLDRFLTARAAERFDVYHLGRARAAVPEALPLPGGATSIGLEADSAAHLPRLPRGAGIYLESGDYSGLDPAVLPHPARVVARTAGHLAALAPLRAPGFEVEVRLSRETAAWLIENVRQAREHAEDWVLHGTPFPTLEQAVAHGADERALIAALSQESSPRVQGLPPCLCPGARIERTPRILRRDLFHADGRLSVDAFTDRYVHDDYRVKSLRCRDCAVDDLCPGAHIQAVRARGFGILQPVAGAWAGVAAARLCDLAEEAPEVPRVRSGSAPVRLPDPLLPVLPSADLPAVPAVDFPSSVRRS